MENLYHVLGLERTATAEEIKTAYLAMVRATHYTQGNSNTEYKDIQEAWHILGDRKRRIIYNYNFFGIDNEDGSYGDPLALSRRNKDGYANLTREEVQDKFRKYSTNMDIRYNREQREGETDQEYSERRSWEYMGPKFAEYQFSDAPYFLVSRWWSAYKFYKVATVGLSICVNIGILVGYGLVAHYTGAALAPALLHGAIAVAVMDIAVVAGFYTVRALTWAKRAKKYKPQLGNKIAALIA